MKTIKGGIVMNAFLPTFTILDAGYSQGSSGGQSTGDAGNTEYSYFNPETGAICIYIEDGDSGAGWYIVDGPNPGYFGPNPPGDGWELIE